MISVMNFQWFFLGYLLEQLLSVKAHNTLDNGNSVKQRFFNQANLVINPTTGNFLTFLFPYSLFKSQNEDSFWKTHRALSPKKMIQNVEKVIRKHVYRSTFFHGLPSIVETAVLPGKREIQVFPIVTTINLVLEVNEIKKCTTRYFNVSNSPISRELFVRGIAGSFVDSFQNTETTEGNFRVVGGRERSSFQKRWPENQENAFNKGVDAGFFAGVEIGVKIFEKLKQISEVTQKERGLIFNAVETAKPKNLNKLELRAFAQTAREVAILTLVGAARKQEIVPIHLHVDLVVDATNENLHTIQNFASLSSSVSSLNIQAVICSAKKLRDLKR